MARHYLNESESQTSEKTKPDENSRKALGQISRDHPSASVSRSANGGGHSTTSNRAVGITKPAAQTTAEKPSTSNITFDIFREEVFSGAPAPQLVENSNWKKLAKDKVSRKENESKKKKNQ
jgi:hypothetical protein